MSYERQPEIVDPDFCRDVLLALADTMYFKPRERIENAEYQLSGDTVVGPMFEKMLTKKFPSFAGPRGTAWVYSDLATIFPKGVLHLHKDGYRNWWRRHVVLQTNPHAWCYHDGAWTHLPVGTVWKVDPRLPHGSVNWGDEPRIHLIFDVEL